MLGRPVFRGFLVHAAIIRWEKRLNCRTERYGYLVDSVRNGKFDSTVRLRKQGSANRGTLDEMNGRYRLTPFLIGAKVNT